MKRRFRALTTVIDVTIDDDLPSRELAALLIDGYEESTDPPILTYRLQRDAVVCDGRYEDRVVDSADVVPMFELDLYQEVAWRASPGWLLHAAALEMNGRVVVFAGQSGAGKTTLTLGLMAHGWQLLTEEMVLIDRELSVHALARPIHAPAEGPQRDAVPTTWRSHAYPLRTETTTVHSVIAQPPTAARITRPRPLHALVRIDHGAGPLRLEPLPPHVAIPRLWECTLRQDADGLSAASAIVARTRPLGLMSTTPAEALLQAFEIARLETW